MTNPDTDESGPVPFWEEDPRLIWSESNPGWPLWDIDQGVVRGLALFGLVDIGLVEHVLPGAMHDFAALARDPAVMAVPHSDPLYGTGVPTLRSFHVVGALVDRSSGTLLMLSERASIVAALQARSVEAAPAPVGTLRHATVSGSNDQLVLVSDDEGELVVQRYVGLGRTATGLDLTPAASVSGQLPADAVLAVMLSPRGDLIVAADARAADDHSEVDAQAIIVERWRLTEPEVVREPLFGIVTSAPPSRVHLRARSGSAFHLTSESSSGPPEVFDFEVFASCSRVGGTFDAFPDLVGPLLRAPWAVGRGLVVAANIDDVEQLAIIDWSNRVATASITSYLATCPGEIQ